MSNDKLLPCPFCGAQPVIAPVRDMHMVECNNAACSVNPESIAAFKHEAIASWNRRTQPATGGQKYGCADNRPAEAFAYANHVISERMNGIISDGGTPPAASGQQEAVQALRETCEKGAAPHDMEDALERLEADGVEVGVPAALLRKLFAAHPAPAQQEIAPAPAALTDEQIAALKKCLYGGELMGWISEANTAAILATASAAPAEQARDAERYRWLRSPDRGMSQLAAALNQPDEPPFFELKCGIDLDVAIDLSIAAQQKSGDGHG